MIPLIQILNGYKGGNQYTSFKSAEAYIRKNRATIKDGCLLFFRKRQSISIEQKAARLQMKASDYVCYLMSLATNTREK